MVELLFSLTSIAMFFWVILILVPAWRITNLIANLNVFPIYLATLYTIGILTIVWTSGLRFISYYSSASGVIQLLSDPAIALIVWIHILCFDQFIGYTIYRENMEQRYVSLPLQSILLFLTLMFGPFGWLCYIIIKKGRKGKKAFAKDS